MYIAIFVGVIIVAIMFHEWGHYATARLFGMKCEKFFLGFGPTLWSVQRGECEYGVKAIPAGGFVKILGMSPNEPISPADRGRTFYEQPAWQRAIVLVAGSATHYVFAAGLIFAAFAFVGLPAEGATTTIRNVAEGSPAAEAGLSSGDRIVAVDGVTTPTFDDVRQEVAARPGETVELTVARGSSERAVSATLGSELPDGTTAGFLGVEPRPQLQRTSAGEALQETFFGPTSVWNLTVINLQALGDAFSPSGIAAWIGQLSGDGPRVEEGPMSLVGAGDVVSTLGQRGDVWAVLLSLASINVVLGTLNLLPLPPLDGGHLASLGIERSVNAVRKVRGKQGAWRLDPAVLTPVALAVILLFGTVFLTALYIDIVRPASGILQ